MEGPLPTHPLLLSGNHELQASELTYFRADIVVCGRSL